MDVGYMPNVFVQQVVSHQSDDEVYPEEFDVPGYKRGG